MRLLRRKRAEREPEPEDRGEEEAVREVGEPEPDRRTVDRAPNGRFTSRKRM